MTTVELIGHITKDGQLEIELPAGLPVGEVRVRIDVVESDWDNQPWTDEEIREMMRPRPKTGAEIAAELHDRNPIAFVDPEIEDPVEWVKAQRKKEAEQRNVWRKEV